MVSERPKIKLIFPCMFELYEPYLSATHINLPYGMGVLTAYLKKQNMYVEQDDLSVKLNHPITLLDRIRHSKLHINKFHEDIDTFFKTNKLSHRLEKLLCKILNFISIKEFDIIGFSIFTYQHFIFALLLSHKIKESTDTPIVFGGPFITEQDQLYPNAFKFIDFMITGDGGLPLSQLVHCLIQKTSPEHIPGIIYKHNGSLTIVPRVESPIEEMPMPDFEGLPLDLYRASNSYKSLFIPYQISRGCNGACTFCNIKNINPFLEYKSYHKVVNELQQLKEKYSSNFFHFCDSGAINNSYEYLEGLCKVFIDHKINIRWSAYARIEHLDREILEKMKLAGCWRLDFGVESGSDRILRLMNKEVTTAQTQVALRDAAGLGIRNFVFLISGYPHERKEDVASTIDFIRRNKKYLWFMHVYVLKVLYGSKLWRHPESYGITNLDPYYSYPYFYYYFSFDEIGGLGWQEKCVQQVRSRQQIVKTIRKYLLFRLVIVMLFQKLIYFMKPRFYIRLAQKRGDK